MEKENKYYENFGRLFLSLGVNERLFKELTLRELKLIKMRFGLEDGVTHTLEETGHEFGVTRERVRGIQAKSLEKMRRCFTSQFNNEELNNWIDFYIEFKKPTDSQMELLNTLIFNFRRNR